MALDPIAPVSCTKCPRLVAFLQQQKATHPQWHNGPVPSFGSRQAALLVIGLAPGLRGANATGRPFTGDFAGDVLYQALQAAGLTNGQFQPDGKDNLVLEGVRITNGVRCVPPQNKPTPAEIQNCRPYLTQELALMTELKVFLVLGRIAHETLLRHYDLKPKDYPFGHGAVHQLPDGRLMLSSYHCSRYNVQTKRLSIAAFQQIVDKAKNLAGL